MNKRKQHSRRLGAIERAEKSIREYRRLLTEANSAEWDGKADYIKVVQGKIRHHMTVIKNTKKNLKIVLTSDEN